MRSITRFFRLIFQPFRSVFAIVQSVWTVGPVRAIQQFVRFCGFVFWKVVQWCASLNYRLLLQGLPAFAAGVVALLVLAFSLFTPAQEIETRYLEQAKTLMRTKEYSEALVCYERLAHLKGDDREILFEMANAALAAGKPERCEQIMNQLAPLNDRDHVGLAKAHLFLAYRLLQNEQSPLRRQLAEQHLRMALEGGVEDKAFANGLMGEILLSKGQWKEAEPHFLIAVKDRPMLRLRLAVLYARMGKMSQSRDQAKLAINYSSNLAKTNLFALPSRLQWAEATTFLEDFGQSVKILEDGLTGTQDPTYRVALAQTYVVWFDHLTRQGISSTSQRLALVEIGLRWDPKNLALLDRLLMIAGIHQTPQASVLQGAAVFGLLGAGSAREVLTNWVGIQEAESQEGAKKLRELAAREPTPQLHFILGVYENQHKNLNAARFHFEQSHKGNPDVPTVANNLAWLLMQTSPDELPRALELIETAIKLDGGRDPNFRDTRGRIHFKMGVRKADAGDAAGARKEYLLAVDDLEATIWTTPIKADVNRTLADVYRRLGMEDMADEHARQADENTPKKKTGKR